MSTYEKFWVVWNPAGTTPRVRHDTLCSARVEAARLAREYRGVEFFVLEATHRVIANDVIETELSDQPF